jgi:hypothetical protein
MISLIIKNSAITAFIGFVLAILTSCCPIFTEKTEHWSPVQYMQELHSRMVNDAEHPKPIIFYLHDSLTYGHSNGWIERRKDFIENLNSKRIIYHSFKEDSIQVIRERKTAVIRFIADIDVTLNGKRNTYHLKVMEVWVRQGLNGWNLIARQAIKA